MIPRIIDAGAVLTTVGGISGIVNPIAVALSAVWFLIRIWESETVRKMTNRSKED